MKKQPIISTYYFPNWHVDPRNEKIHGKGWTEWQVSKHASPRFPGHKQPKVPLWGYEDEADPKVMAKKIEAATSHGIDAFIFDFYWYPDGSYRERCLKEGFLPAANCKDIKFALMWADENPIYVHPCSYYHRTQGTMGLWPGPVPPETFIACTDHMIKTYFTQPNYLRVDGKLYFSIYDPARLITHLGGERTAHLLIDDFRARVAAAGLGEVILDSIIFCWENWWKDDNLSDKIRRAGFDMVSFYSWTKEGFPAMEYADFVEKNKKLTVETTKRLTVPVNPLISAGWDCSPRTVQSDMYDEIGYPYDTIVVNNTPELFEKAFRDFYQYTCSDESSARLLHIGCWNEWTEGAYLEPCQEYGYAKLEAVKRVLEECRSK